MSRSSTGKGVQGTASVLAVVAAFTVLFSVSFALASDMDANARALAKLDDDWSGAARARAPLSPRVASYSSQNVTRLAFPDHSMWRTLTAFPHGR